MGPPFYHKLIVPFLIPFLFFMALGPNIKWIKDKIKKQNISQIIILILCFVISFLIVLKTNTNYLFSTLLFTFSLYLFFSVINSFQKKILIYLKKFPILVLVFLCLVFYSMVFYLKKIQQT